MRMSLDMNNLIKHHRLEGQKDDNQQKSTSDNDDEIDAGQIQFHFDILNRIQFISDISIAFNEVIDYIKSGEKGEIDDINQVLDEYSLSPFDHVQININEIDEEGGKEASILYPDRYLWTIFHFAVRYGQEESVRELLKQKNADPLAILRPAPSNLDYHIMVRQKTNAPRQFALQMSIEGKNLDIFMNIYQSFFQTFKFSDFCEIASIFVTS